MGVGKVAGARSVSILAPADDGNPGHTILRHVGVDEPTPELRSLATALRFHAVIASRLHHIHVETFYG